MHTSKSGEVQILKKGKKKKDVKILKLHLRSYSEEIKSAKCLLSFSSEYFAFPLISKTAKIKICLILLAVLPCA
jgi:hypothetical protein